MAGPRLPAAPRAARPWWRLPGLYWRTLQNLAPGQVSGRLVRLWRMRFGGPFRPPRVRLNVALRRPFVQGGAGVPAMAEDVLHGRFAFIGLPPVEATLPDWRHAPDQSLLWLFNLHYHDWLVALAQAYAATGQPAFAARAAELLVDWVRRNPPGRQPAWHPYPTSRRVVGWCQALAVLQDASAIRAALPELLPSLALQVARLLETQEVDLRGNHHLANLHALTWAEALLAPILPADLAGRLRACAARYWDELLAQVLPDGGHEERSTSYTVGVLQDAFETLVMAERAGWGVPDGVEARLVAMFEHVMSLVTPTGELPLLNDAVAGYPMDARALLLAGATYFARGDWKWVAGDADIGYTIWLFGEEGAASLAELAAVPPEQTSFAHAASGYHVIRSGWGPDADYMLLDAGLPGPRHQLGHAHADTLAVVLYARGRAVLVDPGVGDYRPGPWRDHFRGTAAHNTVAVDGEDSSEVWHAFRTARFATAQVSAWVPDDCVAASHDGYRRLPDPVTHARVVDVLGDACWAITDRLLAGGQVVHHYRWTFQLGPEVGRVSLADMTARVELGDGLVAVFAFEGPEGLTLATEPGWVALGWHQWRPAPALSLHLPSGDAEVVVRVVLRVEAAGEGP
ncbi:MAG: alginate lyase family protein [Candidatus Sericytochromatia bacterium]|nr:alginate lyase family protein [Candidatus Sericytochromatia bacterium]